MTQVKQPTKILMTKHLGLAQGIVGAIEDSIMSENEGLFTEITALLGNVSNSKGKATQDQHTAFNAVLERISETIDEFQQAVDEGVVEPDVLDDALDKDEFKNKKTRKEKLGAFSSYTQKYIKAYSGEAPAAKTSAPTRTASAPTRTASENTASATYTPDPALAALDDDLTEDHQATLAEWKSLRTIAAETVQLRHDLVDLKIPPLSNSKPASIINFIAVDTKEQIEKLVNEKAVTRSGKPTAVSVPILKHIQRLKSGGEGLSIFHRSANTLTDWEDTLEKAGLHAAAVRTDGADTDNGQNKIIVAEHFVKAVATEPVDFKSMLVKGSNVTKNGKTAEEMCEKFPSKVILRNYSRTRSVLAETFNEKPYLADVPHWDTDVCEVFSNLRQDQVEANVEAALEGMRVAEQPHIRGMGDVPGLTPAEPGL